MLATFVIGLREGLEAALIVGIIAAFLKQSNRPDALRAVWAGVAVAVALCLAVGVLLQVVSSGLPQQQQEMLECVVAAIAVAMITYMVLWMRAHSRGLKSDLQNAAGSALASGSAAALVVMAFLAVIREGFETAVFLLAAFQSAVSPMQAAIGVILGLAVAVGLGYLIYRGGVSLNLSRFFRITGVVLVLVAAGLVMSTLRAASEAGWLTAGQQRALDLSAVARPGSVPESLLTGMLGIRSTLPVVEVVAYVLYALPMLAVVLWPPRRTPKRRTIGAVLVGTAVGALVVAGVLALFAPALPAPLTGAQGPFALAAAQGVVARVDGTGGSGTARSAELRIALAPGMSTADIHGQLAGSELVGSTTLRSAGPVDLPRSAEAQAASVVATRFTGTPISTTPDRSTAGLLAVMTVDQVAQANGGRLPVGVRSGTTAALPAAYTDTWTPAITVDAASRTVLDVELRLARTAQVTVPTGATVSAGTVLDVTVTATPDAIAAAIAAAVEQENRRAAHELIGTILPGLLVVFAVVLLAFGLPKLRRLAVPPATSPVGVAGAPPTSEAARDLTTSGAPRPPNG